MIETNGPIRINTPDVMGEVIDGEVIAIHLVSGNYYSITGAGTDVWNMLSSPHTLRPTEIVDVLDRRFDAERSEIEAAVMPFLEEIQGEGLVTACDPVDTGASALLANGEDPRPFVPPRVETYTDMQDLVLLDPVHQVTDRGWPHEQPDAGSRDAATRPA